MRDIDLEYQMISCLQQLPADPNDIARVLYEKGIQGRRWNPCQCPIACYLQQELKPSLKEQDAVSVGVTVASIQREKVEDGFDVELPPGVTLFIELFDHSQYPFLIETK